VASGERVRGRALVGCDGMWSKIRDRIVEHVKSDLVKIEPSKLPGHFRSLQPI